MQTSRIVELAKKIAVRAHSGQLRRDGVTPYILHPERVAAWLAEESNAVVAAAWLHDVVEDSCETLDSLEAEGIPIDVLEAVGALTKENDMAFGTYLFRVRKNHIARKVKIADMLDNLGDDPSPTQVVKYVNGLKFLLQGCL